MDAIWGVILIVAAYFVGAIPWGVVLGRVFAGVDVREHGSKSIGATNSLRVLGRKYSIAVLILDLAKGLIPVVIGRMADLPDWAIGLAALAPMVGHCWSPYIGFTGGKGMAAGGGAAVGLLPWLIILFPVMIVIVAITRYVSLASLIAAVAGGVIAIIFAATGEISWWWALSIVGIAIIIIQRHHANIGRLLSHTENKFGVRVDPTAHS